MKNKRYKKTYKKTYKLTRRYIRKKKNIKYGGTNLELLLQKTEDTRITNNFKKSLNKSDDEWIPDSEISKCMKCGKEFSFRIRNTTVVIVGVYFVVSVLVEQRILKRRRDPSMHVCDDICVKPVEIKRLNIKFKGFTGAIRDLNGGELIIQIDDNKTMEDLKKQFIESTGIMDHFRFIYSNIQILKVNCTYGDDIDNLDWYQLDIM